MPCQQTLSPSKGTDTHLILHWTDPGAKLALSGTRQALTGVKGTWQEQQEGQDWDSLKLPHNTLLMSRQTAHAAYSPGKNGFFNTESIQVTPGPVLPSQKSALLYRHQSSCMRTFMNSCKCQKCWISTKGLETSGCEQKHLNTTAGEEQEEIPWRDSWSVYSQTDCQALGFHAHPCLAATPSFVSRSEFYLYGQKKRRWYIERKTFSQ